MSDAPHEPGITDKARNGKKKVRVGQGLALEPAKGSTWPTISNRSIVPHVESSSLEAVISAANSSIGVSWPVFPQVKNNIGGHQPS